MPMDYYYIRSDFALDYSLVTGKYDKPHANEDFIRGVEAYREHLVSLPAADIRPKWTKVAELPPPLDELVLVVFRTPEGDGQPEIGFGYLSDEGEWFCDDIPLTPEYWLYLPNPPIEAYDRDWKDNGNETISCPHCGTWFPKEREPYMKYCGFCGKRIKEDV